MTPPRYRTVRSHIMSDAPLAFSEFSARERVPLADVFRLVFAILRTRPDAEHSRGRGSLTYDSRRIR
jgi:hypothetical protein